MTATGAMRIASDPGDWITAQEKALYPRPRAWLT